MLQSEKMKKKIKFLKGPHYKTKITIWSKVLWNAKQKNIL